MAWYPGSHPYNTNSFHLRAPPTGQAHFTVHHTSSCQQNAVYSYSWVTGKEAKAQRDLGHLPRVTKLGEQRLEPNAGHRAPYQTRTQNTGIFGADPAGSDRHRAQPSLCAFSLLSHVALCVRDYYCFTNKEIDLGDSNCQGHIVREWRWHVQSQPCPAGEGKTKVQNSGLEWVSMPSRTAACCGPGPSPPMTAGLYYFLHSLCLCHSSPFGAPSPDPGSQAPPHSHLSCEMFVECSLFKRHILV